MRWVLETTSLIHSSAWKLEGAVLLTEVTGGTSDISEYLDFGFYERIWFKDNAGVSPFEPGRWLGVYHCTRCLMCYHVLTQRGIVISCSTVQRVTNIEKTTAEVKDTFQNSDEAMQKKMKIFSEDVYIRDKPNPDHWADLIENDSDFRQEFERIYNNYEIPEADDEYYTPDVFNNTYLNMELALPIDGEGPELACFVKSFREKYGIPIGTANDNPMLDSLIYEVGYPDGHRASLATNDIAENLFAQVYDEGHRSVLLQEIVNHRMNGR